MKATGIVRRIDELDRILLENADRCCRLCHSTGPNLIRNGEDWFCSACAARIKAL